MASRKAKWGIITSAQRFRIILLLRHKLDNRRYPVLVMSDDVKLDSETESVLLLVLYMVLKDPDVGQPVLQLPASLVLPSNDPYLPPPGSSRSETREVNQAIEQSKLTGDISAITPQVRLQ